MGQGYLFGRAVVLSALRMLSRGCLTLPQKRTGSRRNNQASPSPRATVPSVRSISRLKACGRHCRRARA